MIKKTKKLGKADFCWNCATPLDRPYRGQSPEHHGCGSGECVVCPKCGEPLCAFEASAKAKKVKAILGSVQEAPDASGTRAEGGSRAAPAVPPALPAVDAFPVEIFPAPLARFVEEGATALGCPSDYFAVPMLVLAGAAIGTARAISPKASWTEHPSLFACVIGPPASGKSPALNEVATPLGQRQSELEADFRRDWAAYESALERHKAQRRRSRRSGTSDGSDSSGRDKGKSGTREGRHRQRVPAGQTVLDLLPEPPVMRRVLTSDATVESLSPILANSPRGIALVRDELAAWKRGFDMYRGGRGNDRQFFLSLWSGSRIVLDRKSNPRPLIIERPFLGLVGGFVPDMVAELADEEGREDGFLDRILFAWPDASPLPVWSDAEISDTARQAWKGALDCLWRLQPLDDDPVKPRPKVLRLSKSAKTAWVAFFDKQAEAVNTPECPPGLKGTLVKLRGYALRLALIVQGLRFAVGEADLEGIDEVSMEAAITLVGYFTSHAEKVHAAMAKPEEGVRETDAALLQALSDILAATSGEWQGTTTELLELLNSRAEEPARQCPDWPGSVVSLGRSLRRLASREAKDRGLVITFGRSKGRDGARLVTIRREVSEAPDCQKAGEARGGPAGRPSETSPNSDGAWGEV
jgi:hypothetical protein